MNRQSKGTGDNFIYPTPEKMEILTNRMQGESEVGMDMEANESIIEGFTKFLAEDGKRSKTIDSYVGDVGGFLTYLRQMGTEFTGDLQRYQITSYRNHLVENSYEASTINKKINSLQSFNRWLVDKGLTPETVVDLRKDRVKVASGSEKQVEVFNEKQLERLLFCVQGSKVNARDRAIVMTLLYTGVRVSELCDIKVRNVDFLMECLRITGKGGKLREVPMKPEVSKVIREYLTERSRSKHAGSEYLFLGQRGAIQRDAVNTMLEKLADKACLDIRLKPHTFRHTFCTRLVKRGVPITTVSKLAGHANVDTTARFYISSSRDDKMKAVNML